MHLPYNTFSSIKNALPNFSKLLVISVSSILVLSGCQASKGLFDKFDDGSLEYQQSKTLSPLKLPVEQETAPFVPLYSTPTAGVNTLDVESDSGKRYQLPPPYRKMGNSQ